MKKLILVSFCKGLSKQELEKLFNKLNEAANEVLGEKTIVRITDEIDKIEDEIESFRCTENKMKYLFLYLQTYSSFDKIIKDSLSHTVSLKSHLNSLNWVIELKRKYKADIEIRIKQSKDFSNVCESLVFEKPEFLLEILKKM